MLHWKDPASVRLGLLLYVPGGQYVHAADDVAPVVAEYRPPGHATHAVLPPVPYHPSAHAVHVFAVES